MLCLGIESTAHTIGIGICELDRHGKAKITASQLDMYKPINEGIVPRKAADHHEQFLPSLLKNSLEEAGAGIGDIGAFAFSQGPGIGQCLRVSCAAAKYLAARHSKPIVGVNHCMAHLEITKWFTGLESPAYLYVSGGNTQIIIESDFQGAPMKNKIKNGGAETGAKGMRGNANAARATKYHVLGETLDIGIGNLFDTFGRSIGLEHAHGSVVAKLASEGKRYIELPYNVKGTNMQFSGLLTAASRMAGRVSKEDLSYSLMETAFSVACEALERCAYLSGKEEITVCGGVAQNQRLCQMLSTMAKENGWKFAVAPAQYNRDNGAMIALAGARLFSEGKTLEMKDAKPRQDWRIDQA
ncbi:MAG: UGMP family protein [Candidatus Micrarchaeia archaeon]